MNDQLKIDSTTDESRKATGAKVAAMEWTSAPAVPVAEDNEIHLWRANLDFQSVDSFRDCLSAAEVIRADAFHAERDQHRFIAAHGILRLILSRYLGASADAIRFAAGPFGKPSLLENANGIHFNLSHSGDLAVIAVAGGTELGVDVEQVRDDLPFDEMAGNYFEPEEIWAVRTLRGTEKARKFFELWTMKEALLKASGVGIGDGLNPSADGSWIHKFSIINAPTFGVAKEYAGAIAVEGKDWRLSQWEWHN